MVVATFTPPTILSRLAMPSNYAGRGKRRATPRPTAGRPANEAAFTAALDRLEKLITRATGKHDYATANRIWRRMEGLTAGYEGHVLCAAPDYPDEDADSAATSGKEQPG
jgi:hypothetical protein